MLDTIREHLTVEKDGVLTIQSPELVEGAKVEVLIVFENGKGEPDATDYLLSTEANRREMDQILEDLKQPENFIPLDMEAYEKRIASS